MSLYIKILKAGNLIGQDDFFLGLSKDFIWIEKKELARSIRQIIFSGNFS
jgi:hypothetical protein